MGDQSCRIAEMSLDQVKYIAKSVIESIVRYPMHVVCLPQSYLCHIDHEIAAACKKRASLTRCCDDWVVHASEADGGMGMRRLAVTQQEVLIRETMIRLNSDSLAGGVMRAVMQECAVGGRGPLHGDAVMAASNLGVSSGGIHDTQRVLQGLGMGIRRSADEMGISLGEMMHGHDPVMMHTWRNSAVGCGVNDPGLLLQGDDMCVYRVMTHVYTG